MTCSGELGLEKSLAVVSRTNPNTEQFSKIYSDFLVLILINYFYRNWLKKCLPRLFNPNIFSQYNKYFRSILKSLTSKSIWLFLTNSTMNHIFQTIFQFLGQFITRSNFCKHYLFSFWFFLSIPFDYFLTKFDLVLLVLKGLVQNMSSTFFYPK